MGTYLRPLDLKDALSVLAGEAVTVAAGCTDLFAATEAQQLPGTVLDITAIDALRGITRTAKGWRIGATTSWSDVIAAKLPPAFDMLKEAGREVGAIQIQNAGTIAGNLCNASPAADGVPPLLALEAQVELASAEGLRRLPLAQFLTGVRRTDRKPGELVTAIHVPETATTGRSRFLKLGARRYLVISIAMVAVRLDITDGKIADAAIAVGSCSPVATRLPELETALNGHDIGDANSIVSNVAVAASLSPITDIRGDAAYRSYSAATLLRRAIADLALAVAGGAQ